MTVFESNAPVTFFDYFRIPYTVRPDPAADAEGVTRVGVPGESAIVAWPAADRLASRGLPVCKFALETMTLFARVDGALPDAGDWRALHELHQNGDRTIGTIWQRDNASTLLPFDPNDVIAAFWTERYLRQARPALSRRALSLARRAYYAAKPVIPRGWQLSARRTFSRVQSRSQFPDWPIETTLHDFYDFLFGIFAGAAKRPVPFIHPWPNGRSWAIVLTHDVEAGIGYRNLRRLLQVEVAAGYRSSWNFVPQNRYVVEDDQLEELRAGGFEVGVHGLFHDGRDVLAATFQERLPAIRAYAEAWKATGFRSPATLRSAELMPLLGFEYDSSYSDTAPFEPQPGGCCSWLPYQIGDLVELPITLAQDHTLFELLGHRDASNWIEKAEFLRGRGGMALIITHPDYADNADLLSAYQSFLAAFAQDSTAWKALPGDVSRWWRRRSESTLERVDGTWRVTGPAEGEASVGLVPPTQIDST